MSISVHIFLTIEGSIQLMLDASNVPIRSANFQVSYHVVVIDGGRLAA